MKLIKTFLFLKLLFFINITFSNQMPIDIEEQFRELSSELRCLVCQNQSLLDSDSDLAKDLKKIIYEKLKEGKSKYEIKGYLVERYGEFILFKPLLNNSNLLLWLAPFLSILIIGFIGFRKTKIKQKK